MSLWERFKNLLGNLDCGGILVRPDGEERITTKQLEHLFSKDLIYYCPSAIGFEYQWKDKWPGLPHKTEEAA